VYGQYFKVMMALCCVCGVVMQAYIAMYSFQASEGRWLFSFTFREKVSSDTRATTPVSTKEETQFVRGY